MELTCTLLRCSALLWSALTRTGRLRLDRLLLLLLLDRLLLLLLLLRLLLRRRRLDRLLRLDGLLLLR